MEKELQKFTIPELYLGQIITIEGFYVENPESSDGPRKTLAEWQEYRDTLIP